MAVGDEERVRRWVDAGGTVAICEEGPPAVVSLRRCDGGEEVDRFSTDDAAVVELVARLAG